MKDINEEKMVVYADPEIKKLIPKFIEHQRDMLGLIQTAGKDLNFSDLKHLGHQMKGACGSYGFLALAELAAKIEKSAQDQDVETLHQLILQLENSLSNMKIEYRKK